MALRGIDIGTNGSGPDAQIMMRSERAGDANTLVVSLSNHERCVAPDRSGH
jgi:hypothetical protein